MTQDDTNETEPTSGFDPLSTTGPDIDDVLYEALEQDHDVRLVRAPEYGYDFEIDEQRLFGTDEGLPRETFSWPLERCPIAPAAEGTVEDLLDERQRRLGGGDDGD